MTKAIKCSSPPTDDTSRASSDCVSHPIVCKDFSTEVEGNDSKYPGGIRLSNTRFEMCKEDKHQIQLPTVQTSIQNSQSVEPCIAYKSDRQEKWKRCNSITTSKTSGKKRLRGKSRTAIISNKLSKCRRFEFIQRGLFPKVVNPRDRAKRIPLKHKNNANIPTKSFSSVSAIYENKISKSINLKSRKKYTNRKKMCSNYSAKTKKYEFNLEILNNLFTTVVKQYQEFQELTETQLRCKHIISLNMEEETRWYKIAISIQNRLNRVIIMQEKYDSSTRQLQILNKIQIEKLKATLELKTSINHMVQTNEISNLNNLFELSLNPEIITSILCYFDESLLIMKKMNYIFSMFESNFAKNVNVIITKREKLEKCKRYCKNIIDSLYIYKKAIQNKLEISTSKTSKIYTKLWKYKNVLPMSVINMLLFNIRKQQDLSYHKREGRVTSDIINKSNAPDSVKWFTGIQQNIGVFMKIMNTYYNPFEKYFQVKNPVDNRNNTQSYKFKKLHQLRNHKQYSQKYFRVRSRNITSSNAIPFDTRKETTNNYDVENITLQNSKYERNGSFSNMNCDKELENYILKDLKNEMDDFLV